MCYTIPLAGAIITSAAWKGEKSSSGRLLNLMFWGGAIFGVVDHLFNGELLLVGENLYKDLFLGGLISVAILAGWGVMLVLTKTKIKAKL